MVPHSDPVADAPNAPPAVIAAKRLTLHAGLKCLLRDASFSIDRGKFVVLLGASGSGKSSLLRVLAGLESTGDGARVQWQGEISYYPETIRQRIGLVFQQPALLDEWSPMDNVQIAIDHADAQRAPVSEPSLTRKAAGWLEHLGVPVSVRINQLSGGQRQRLSLAQALASRPAVLFYDEPTTGLDDHTASRALEWIAQAHREGQVTTVVVTHDYERFAQMAEEFLWIDPSRQAIERYEQRDLARLREAMQIDHGNATAEGSLPATAPRRSLGAMISRPLEGIGEVALWLGRGLAALLMWGKKGRWNVRFFLHHARLVFGGTAILYLAIAGGIVGFVTTFFSLRYLPFRVYTEPLLMEELVSAIGFSLYRVLIPVLASLLIAARSAAAVSSDLGNKRYGGQLEAMQLLGASPHRYLLPAVLWSFLLGTWLLTQIAYLAASLCSQLSFVAAQPRLGASFWQQNFTARLYQPDQFGYAGLGWNLCKMGVVGFGIGLLVYALAMRPKWSGASVSRGITTTILWCTLWALVVHMVFAFFEFQQP
jgi:ABC-type multidrug transport system ATPase subunit/ABC-type transporter Mla maintaining outer membrane lipid asymmetry permease subunit MlaE